MLNWDVGRKRSLIVCVKVLSQYLPCLTDESLVKSLYCRYFGRATKVNPPECERSANCHTTTFGGVNWKTPVVWNAYCFIDWVSFTAFLVFYYLFYHNFLFKASRPVLGPTKPATQWVPSVLYLDLMLPRWSCCSPPSSAEVKSVWICNSFSPYAIMP
jgi:hypothetical protein